MEAPEYKNIFENESSHFFYVANHKIVISLVKNFSNLSAKTNLKILDAGCGTGLLAKKLTRFGQVLGVDVSPLAIKFAKKRGIEVKKASVTKLPFRQNQFNLVVSIDVIYHQAVENDQKALGEFYRVLAPGGLLILRVPARKLFSTAHDAHVHTRQRYEKKELERKLKGASFAIEKISYVNMMLAPIALFLHFWEKINPPPRSSSGITRVSQIINVPLSLLLSAEAYLLPHLNLPFGIGLIAVCRKK